MALNDLLGLFSGQTFYVVGNKTMCGLCPWLLKLTFLTVPGCFGLWCLNVVVNAQRAESKGWVWFVTSRPHRVTSPRQPSLSHFVIATAAISPHQNTQIFRMAIHVQKRFDLDHQDFGQLFTCPNSLLCFTTLRERY
jgi:hypothetical protein